MLGTIAKGGIVLPLALLAFGVALLTLYKKQSPKKRYLFFGAVTAVLGLFGLLQALGLLSGVPVLAFGIPAVLSCYFDVFSGFVQAYVFTLLTMVYIGNSCPPPEKAEAAQ